MSFNTEIQPVSLSSSNHRFSQRFFISPVSVRSSGLMAGGCRVGQYWDALLKKCIRCEMVCKQPHAITRCTSYCDIIYCKALPGHYYDLLLKRCVKCADICGRHPADCSQHCHTLTPPVPIKKLLLEVTSHTNSRRLSVPTDLGDSTILLYSLLALCMMLLLTSLSLALAVLLRGAKAKTSKQRPKQANHQQQGSVVQKCQEISQPGKSSKAFQTNSNHTTDPEPSYDSSPTETCVCMHCFPDLKALGPGNDRPLRAPFSAYQQPVLHKAQILKAGPVWRNEDLHASGLQVQEEAAVA